MTFGPATLATRFNELEAQAGKPSRYVVAFSGGLDSSALLHCLTELRRQNAEHAAVALLAVHVDHRLHAESGDWSAHCKAFADRIGVECQTLLVDVDETAGKGLEAAAREARYAALAAAMQSGDWLLSAHHQDDQAETLLLNLVRGSGPAGVAGIGGARRFGPGWLVRPLLNVDRTDLYRYATAASIQWLDDPTNEDRRFDRNFLRHEVLPVFAKRWPDIALRLQRSASHASEAAELMTELARIDLRSIGGRPRRLDIDGLQGLSLFRQKNLLRFALRELGLTTPSAQLLDRVVNEVIPARIDAQPLVTWSGASVRRYRNALYLLPEKLLPEIVSAPLSEDELQLGTGMGRLKLLNDDDYGLSADLVQAGLSIGFRKGGEEIKPISQQHTRKLKKLLQEEGIVPWMRDRLPLVYAGDRLVAVADLWIADDAAAKPGYKICWIDRPALH